MHRYLSSGNESINMFSKTPDVSPCPLQYEAKCPTNEKITHGKMV